MRMKTRRLALGGVLCALAVSAMLLGGMVPVAVYSCPILAMVALLPLREEFGTPTALTAYAAVALLALLLTADKEAACVYVFLGWYPPVQPYFDRIRPRALRLTAMLAACNACVLAMYALLVSLFRLEAVATEFAGFSGVFLAALLTMGNVVFVVTDIVLERLGRLWRTRLRRRWFRE